MGDTRWAGRAGDFITEDCVGLGEYVLGDVPGGWQLIFAESRLTVSQLEDLIASI